MRKFSRQNRHRQALSSRVHLLEDSQGVWGSKGSPLQSSCLENPTDRAAWRATVHGVAKSRT